MIAFQFFLVSFFINVGDRDTVLNIPYEEIIFNDLPIISPPYDIVKIMGQPDSIVLSNDDCGFFSPHSQDGVFYRYYYEGMNFVGDENSMQLEKMDFKKGLSLEIQGFTIHQNTSLEQLVREWDISIEQLNDVRIEIHETNPLDEYFNLYFKNGKAAYFELYTPC